MTRERIDFPSCSTGSRTLGNYVGSFLMIGTLALMAGQTAAATTHESPRRRDDSDAAEEVNWIDVRYEFDPPQAVHPAVALLRKWRMDDSGYDEAVWPEVKQALDKDRMSSGKLFR